MLLIHRGVVKATALATPLDELIAMRTLLNATEVGFVSWLRIVVSRRSPFYKAMPPRVLLSLSL